MHIVFYIPPAPVPEPGFWEFKLSDAINSIIALMSVLIAFFVYRYQQDKDKRDYEQQRLEQHRAALIKQEEQERAAHIQTQEQVRAAQQQERIAKQEWVRLLLIEPNREYILSFFTDLEEAMAVMNATPVLPVSRKRAVEATHRLLNEFERRFLTYFDSIDHDVANENKAIFDELRDTLIDTLAVFTDEDYITQHKSLITSILTARNSFLSKLYTFSFATTPAQ
ncbi:hypothetical protein [Hymenobacter metallicola]|uniref:Uncharacterized protein n=1 Tax=Hymenobacter metallicola TaxID=2563114 RepID=A0A4Z0QD00_9BACT|nr:hypothetical protein [Hymenobacter metallicola]TGE26921.1 hypothetical protein E5K02_10970 [Hymenobacter metallicola]